MNEQLAKRTWRAPVLMDLSRFWVTASGIQTGTIEAHCNSAGYASSEFAHATYIPTTSGQAGPLSVTCTDVDPPQF